MTATVFDLDETLVGSAPAWNRVIEGVAGRHGHRWSPRDWAAIQGTGTRHWTGYLAGRCPGLTAESALTECVDGMLDELGRGGFGPLPGAADAVAAAAELGPVGLVSASPRRYVEATAEACGFASRLATVVTGDDVTHGKPAPDPYLLAARNLGVPPARCLAIEDSGSGIRSAHAAGMTVLAIPNEATASDVEVLKLARYQAADAHIAAKILRTWHSAPGEA
ncbi:HAD family phosphatase [Amycolatopsis sp. OK19-0408]|uniref:HAD family phosphatase n=1 Tax=Amycolatopsis iheyensis TaxID=2945988 RepID=A0A9X2NKF2_9PSEU|nr:HAD family phosphatase [Amycolatopsis iheyensis]MCR6488420.1 HAD family phosphatase [Amycolatopsis iheyensis]